MEVIQTKQSTEKLWHRILIFQEASPCIWNNPGKPMKIIKFLVLIRACGEIEPCIFVVFFWPCFLQHYPHPNLERNKFIHNIESISIIRRMEIWQIRRGGQITIRISEKTDMTDGSRYGVHRALLCGEGSIINGDGR